MCPVLAGARDGDDADGDADAQRDGGESRGRAGLVSAEVAQREAHGEWQTTGGHGRRADRGGGGECDADDDRHHPRDQQQGAEMISGRISESDAPHSRDRQDQSHCLQTAAAQRA